MKSKLFYKEKEFNFIEFLFIFKEYKNLFYLIIIVSLLISFFSKLYLIKTYLEYNVKINSDKNIFSQYILGSKNEFEVLCAENNFCNFIFPNLLYYDQNAFLNSIYLSEDLHQKVFDSLSFKSNIGNFKTYFNKVYKENFLSDEIKSFNILFNNKNDFDEYKKNYLFFIEKEADINSQKKFIDLFKNAQLLFAKDYIEYHNIYCEILLYMTCSELFYENLQNDDLIKIKNELFFISENLKKDGILKYSNNVMGRAILWGYEQNLFVYSIIDRIKKIIIILETTEEKILKLSKALTNNTYSFDLNTKIKRQKLEIISAVHVFLFCFAAFIFMLITVVLSINFYRIKKYTLR